jgi:uncharacterized membrane protein YsdA (DUF1294 family)
VKLLLVYLMIVNIAAFLMMGYDKSLAKARERRIPEKRLFGVAAAGGALGLWLGMQGWRHKTKHRSFVVGVPLLFILNVAIIAVLMQLQIS